jgi:hypothetical protein
VIRASFHSSCASSSVHLTGGKLPITGDFYRYRYLAATLTGGKFQKNRQNLKFSKKFIQ